MTDHEATLLALVVRGESLTAYQISKIYADSPVSNFNTSAGKIYPIIRRLTEAGYLKARRVPGDGRRTEQISTTKLGKAAVREWVKATPPHHLLLEDPFRTKVQSFDLLTREERIAWISELKVQLLAKLESVEQYAEEFWVPFQELAHDNAVRSIRSRMDWLDLVLRQIVRETE